MIFNRLIFEEILLKDAVTYLTSLSISTMWLEITAMTFRKCGKKNDNDQLWQRGCFARWPALFRQKGCLENEDYISGLTLRGLNGLE